MNKQERSPVTLSAELRRSPDEAKSGQFSIVGYTGAEITSWWGNFVIDIAGIQVKKQTPVLREHERDRVIGWSNKVLKDERGLVFEGGFTDKTKDGQEARALAEDGFPWQASVGIVPRAILRIKKEESHEANGRTYTGPLEIWTKSKVGEVSLVSWGADSDTSMQLLSEASQQRVAVEDETITLAEQEDKPMTVEELREKHPDIYKAAFDAGAQSVNLEAAKEEGIQLERGRVVEILEAKADESETLKAISEGLSADASFKAFYLAEKAKREAGVQTLSDDSPPPAGVSPKPKGQDDKQGFLALVDAYQAEQKCSKGVAMAAVARKHPETHKAWLDEQAKR